MRELHEANVELSRREEELAERLDLESSRLVAAQRTAGFATVYFEKGKEPRSSAELNRMLGLPAGARIQLDDIFTMIHPLDAARVLDQQRRFYAEEDYGVDLSYTHRIIRGDGELRWLRWSLRKLRAANTRAAAVLGTVQDITEERATERRMRALQLRAERRAAQLDRLSQHLAEAKAEVEAAMRTRTRFLSQMADQLRTPLNTLVGTLDLLSIEPRTPEDAKRLRAAARAGEQLSLLIGDMIEQAGGDTIEYQLATEPLDLAAILSGTEEYWRLTRPELGDRLRFDIKGGFPPAVLSDPMRLRELLDQLLEAAVAGGAEQEVRFAASWDDGLRIELAGAGAPPTLDVPSPLIAAFEGRSKIAERHVEVRVPLAPTERAPTTKATPEQLRTATGEQPLVLVVDDTETNRQVLGGLLQSIGCQSEIAVNGAEAVEAAAATRFDAILMDVRMPVLDGEAATRAIRASGGPHSQTPIIGVTAHGLQAERDRLLAAGMSACLAKPIERDKLVTALKTAFAAGTAQGGAQALFDLTRFREAFSDLPGSYRDRFRGALKSDLRAFGDDLARAVGEGDEEATRRAAHALKGVAVNAGAVAILDALAQLREQPFALAAQHLPLVEERIERSVGSIDELYGTFFGDG
nr:response regulator [Sphingomicrobium astaxanthinifaciens]